MKQPNTAILKKGEYYLVLGHPTFSAFTVYIDDINEIKVHVTIDNMHKQSLRLIDVFKDIVFKPISHKLGKILYL